MQSGTQKGRPSLPFKVLPGQKGHWDRVLPGPLLALRVEEGSYLQQTYLRLRNGKEITLLKPLNQMGRLQI